MRDQDTIDSELRLVAALRRAARERGGLLPTPRTTSTHQRPGTVGVHPFSYRELTSWPLAPSADPVARLVELPGGPVALALRPVVRPVASAAGPAVAEVELRRRRRRLRSPRRRRDSVSQWRGPPNAPTPLRQRFWRNRVGHC